MRLLESMWRILACDAFNAELEARLAHRKANRPANSARSLKGAATKRRAHHGING